MRAVAFAGTLLALALAGCGGDAEPAPSPVPTTSGLAASPSTSAAAATRATLPLLAAFEPSEPLQVVVQVASPGACPLEQVRYAVQESAEQLSVRVTAAAAECSGEPELGNVQVTLERPRGDRELVDASTGAPVQVATGEPPGPVVPTVDAERE